MITRAYKTLCEIVIRHGFYLNDGETDFDALTGDEQKVALKRYRFDEAVAVSPIEATTRTMRNQQVFFRQQPDRVFLAVKTEDADPKPMIGMDDNLTFVFLVKTVDPVFQQLTANTFPGDRLFLFTNCQPLELPETTVVQLPKLADNTRIDDSFLLSADDTKTLLDKYVAPIDRYGLIGLIYIRVKGSGAGNNLLTGAGETTNAYPVFKIHFNNASTFWKYKKPSDGFEATTSSPKPLTKYGFIKITHDGDFPLPHPPASYQYPNPRPDTFEISGSDIYSVIFI